MTKSLLLSACFVVLAGCAAAGPGYESMRSGIEALPDGTARVVFFRTDDSLLYSARSARIKIDGQESGKCALGGFFYKELQPGYHRLTVDTWDSPGRCEVRLGVDAGAIYYFQVDARAESFWAFAGPAAITDVIGGNVLISVAAGVGGVTAESYGRECGGLFRLYPVDPMTARARLSNLRFSNSGA